MSLIQEALKRQQQEEDGTLPTNEPLAPPSLPEKPAAPPSDKVEPPTPSPTQLLKQTPPTPAPTEKKKLAKLAPSVAQPQPVTKASPAKDKKNSKAPAKNKPVKKTKKSQKKEETGVLPAIAGMILLVILLLASVGGAVIYGLKHFNVEMPWQASPSTPEEVIAEADTAESISMPTQVSTSDTHTQNNTPMRRASAVSKQVAHAPEPAQETQEIEPVAKPTNFLKVDDNAITATSAEDKIEPVVVTPAAVVAPTPVPPPAPKPPVIWPPAKLKGIVGSGSGGAAMINDTVAGVNEKVDGILIVSIESKGAWLEYKKERRFLKVGKSFE